MTEPAAASAVGLTTLSDGGQRPADVARGIASFLARAERTLDIAVYDVRFETDAGALVLAALLSAVQRGDRRAAPLQRRPPGPDPGAAASGDRAPGDRGPPGGHAWHRWRPRPHAPQVRRPRRGGRVDGVDELDRRLVVAPGERHRHDRFTPEIAYAYSLAFEQLWTSGTVEHTGDVEPRPQDVDGSRVRAWFCPEYGEALSHRIAKHIGKARKRVRIASPVLTSGPILGTLVEVVKEGRSDLAGVVDDTQVDQVFYQWRTNGVSEWKIPLLRTVIEGAPWSGKVTTPWAPDSVHDFMHAKVVVADDTSFVGSFNLSRSGERNAENVVEIRDAALADRLAAYVDEVRARYPRATPPGQ